MGYFFVFWFVLYTMSMSINLRSMSNISQTSIVALADHFFAHLSTDILIVAVLIGALILYGMSRSAHKLGSLLISVYFATLLFNSFPYYHFLPAIIWTKIILWAFFVFIVEFVSPQFVTLPVAFSRVRHWIDIILLALATSFSIIVILFSEIGLQALYTPTLVPVGILTNPAAFFWTLLGSLAFLYYVTFI